MKLFSIVVYYKGGSSATSEVRLLKGAYDLNSFGFFQRATVREFMIFTGKVILERSTLASRSSTKEQEYMCHMYVRADGLAGMVVSDSEYPQRVAHNLISRVLDEFSAKVPAASWPNIAESNVQYNGLDEYLQKYQNPREADAMTRVQDELDETKVVLHNTIQAVLERGEKLDDLVAKSEGLSAQSKMFYTSARKMNKCCSWV